MKNIAFSALALVVGLMSGALLVEASHSSEKKHDNVLEVYTILGVYYIGDTIIEENTDYSVSLATLDMSKEDALAMISARDVTMYEALPDTLKLDQEHPVVVDRLLDFDKGDDIHPVYRIKGWVKSNNSVFSDRELIGYVQHPDVGRGYEYKPKSYSNR